jgi:twitching motility protein PilI
LSLRDLIAEPFSLLLELERRAREAIAGRQGRSEAAEEWIGVAFRLGSQQFVSARSDVREVLPAPEQLTRIPGSKPWLRGIANVRGQLLTIVDLRAFLGSGQTRGDRKARMLMLASRDVPTAVLVDEVLGFRRFAQHDFSEEAPATEIRCEHYVAGVWKSDGEAYPLFAMDRLLDDPSFLNAGVQKAG